MRITSLISMLVLLVGCGQQPSNTLTIGTISGPETELVETAKEVAKKDYDLNIKIVEFNDYNLPNEALQDESLDANVYQHLPYLKAAMAAHGYDLEVIGKTFIYPAGIYSNRHHSLSELPENAVIAIPNDLSNEARALILIEKAGLIKLKTEENPSLEDIISNPKHLQFKALDAAQLPRALEDVDAAVINTTFALPAGLNPTRDALFIEDKDSPYANIIVIKKDSAKTEALKLFVKAFQSKEVQNKAKELFGDAAIPAW